MTEKHRTILFWTGIVILIGIFIGGSAYIVRARLPEGGVKFPDAPDIQTDKLKEIFNLYE